MLFTVKQIVVTTGQPVKIVFSNPDATDHNLVIVKPDALAEVGMAANEMAKDPKNANSDFVPASKRELILHASPMIGPTRKLLVSVLRFRAPPEPGIYPYVCTFPGHWVVMSDGRTISGVVVKEEPSEFQVMTNLLTPEAITRIAKADIDQRVASKISPMPAGLVNVLTKEEIVDLLSYLEAGGYQLPVHL